MKIKGIVRQVEGSGELMFIEIKVISSDKKIDPKEIIEKEVEVEVK